MASPRSQQNPVRRFTPTRQQDRQTGVVHISLAGPGKWENGVLSFATGGLAALLKPEVQAAFLAGQSVRWLHGPQSAQDFVHGDYSYKGVIAEFLRPEDMAPDENGKVRSVEDFKRILRTEAYGDFCKNALWMTIHGYRHSVEPEALRQGWESYKLVNEAFARKVFLQMKSGEIDPGDSIVVHDFQLALVPKYLAEMAKSDPEVNFEPKIVGYWHVPMPTSSELLQSKSNRWDVGLPADIAHELIDALANTEGVRWGCHSKVWQKNFNECQRAMGIKSEVNPLFVLPGYLDKGRLRTQAFGLSSDEREKMLDEEFNKLFDNLTHIADSNTRLETPEILADFKQWEHEVANSEELTSEQKVEFIKQFDTEAAQRIEEAAGLVTDASNSELLGKLKIDTYDKEGTVVARTFTREELDATPLDQRGQIITCVGRADPKNGMLTLMRSLIEIQQDESIALKPSLLLVCAKNGDGVKPYEQEWNKLTGQRGSDYAQYDIDPTNIGLIEQFKALGGNIVHMNGKMIDGKPSDIAPFAQTLTAHNLADISVTPSARGGRDLVALEAMCLKDSNSKPLVNVVSSGAGASETLRGAIKVHGIGPARELAMRTTETRAELEARQSIFDANHDATSASLLAESLKTAIQMPTAEREVRFGQLFESVSKEWTYTWTKVLERTAQKGANKELLGAQFAEQHSTGGPAFFESL